MADEVGSTISIVLEVVGMGFCLFLCYVMLSHGPSVWNEPKESKTESQSEKHRVEILKAKVKSMRARSEIEVHGADDKAEVDTVILETQLEQKDEEIKRLHADLSAVLQQNANKFQAMIASNSSVTEKVQKIVGECGHLTCHDKLNKTVKAYENNLRNLNKSCNDELSIDTEDYSSCQKQVDNLATKPAIQGSKMRALQDALSNTEVRLQMSEDANSTLQRNIQDLSQKTIGLVAQIRATKLQLDESKKTVKEYHDQFWPLHNEHAKMKAEITFLKTSRDERQDQILDLEEARGEHCREKDELEDKIESLEKQRIEAATRAESWRLKWQDLKAEKERITMYSDRSGDITMIDPPGPAMRVDIPWVLEAGQENIKLRLEVENLTATLEEARNATVISTKKTSDDAIDYRLKFEAAKKELEIVKNDLDVAVKDYLGVLQDMKMDPTNLYHPLYKKIEGLMLYKKQTEEQNRLLKAKLEDERTRSWDRRSSMVECLS